MSNYKRIIAFLTNFLLSWLFVVSIMKLQGGDVEFHHRFKYTERKREMGPRTERNIGCRKKEIRSGHFDKAGDY